MFTARNSGNMGRLPIGPEFKLARLFLSEKRAKEREARVNAGPPYGTKGHPARADAKLRKF